MSADLVATHRTACMNSIHIASSSGLNCRAGSGAPGADPDTRAPPPPHSPSSPPADRPAGSGRMSCRRTRPRSSWHPLSHHSRNLSSNSLRRLHGYRHHDRRGAVGALHQFDRLHRPRPAASASPPDSGSAGAAARRRTSIPARRSGRCSPRSGRRSCSSWSSVLPSS